MARLRNSNVDQDVRSLQINLHVAQGLRAVGKRHVLSIKIGSDDRAHAAGDLSNRMSTP